MLTRLLIGLGMLSPCAYAASACTAPHFMSAPGGAAASICDLIKNNPGRSGKRVLLRGTYLSDGLEDSFVQDQRCRDVLVEPFDGPQTTHDRVYEEFSGFALRGVTTPSLIRIEIEVDGVLRKTGTRRYRLDIIRYVKVDPKA